MTARPRVVIIDDDPISERAIRRALPHCDVTSAGTVETGCALAREQDPGLVVLDFYLPDGTGRDAITRMRADGITAPILLVSGAFDAGAWSEWAAFEADDFLAKPFVAKQFRDKAERLLHTRELELQVRALRERDEREAHAARRLLDRMLGRTDFDPTRSRVESLPANGFGGDLVCGARGSGERFRWLVGDVAGHTLASALVTIPLAMVFYATLRRGMAMAETLESYDRELGAMLPVTMFAASCLCELDRATGTLAVVNAGCPPVLVRRCDGRVDEVASTRRPLGISGAAEDMEAIATIAVAPGDRIYVMSDGLLDVVDARGEAFGPRVRELLEGGAGFDGIAAAWRAHAGDTAREDDLTLVEIAV